MYHEKDKFERERIESHAIYDKQIQKKKIEKRDAVVLLDCLLNDSYLLKIEKV